MKAFRSVGWSICMTLPLGTCNRDTDSATMAQELGQVAAFSEMVAAGVKRIALSAPMESAQMEKFLPEAEKIAQEYGVSLYRERDFIQTDLFPATVAAGKELCVLYRDKDLSAYLQLKQDQAALVAANAYAGKEREAIARRLGRLLGYPPDGINRLLAKATAFRTLHDFGVREEQITLFYKDLEAAARFYGETLGLQQVAQDAHSRTFRVGSTSLLTLMDSSHPFAEKPKTVAIALLTEQLEAWWSYIQEKNVVVKYPLKVTSGGPHDSFVAIDPEGYLLEFERFHQHPENEKFIPVLSESPTVFAQPGSTVPDTLGFKGMITWLYYRDLLAMQGFYEEVLGFERVADQGWTKIYQVSPTGFVGLVDERRGMLQFTEEKAVILSFSLDNPTECSQYLRTYSPFVVLESDSVGVAARDPEFYRMELK